ncbi:RNA polymerase sigma factor [Acidicapsa ligni]|uniref:RNA polymerase sigma factor n=1 Tax=Acidicapsa ligni TaxID=542300 RepID=UPI0021E0BEDC|nr:sigma-70 family RNA polymerase sigma factor [Acidicapsa ligni]
MTHVEISANSVAGSCAPSLPCCNPSPNFEELALPLFDSVYRFAHWLTRSKTDAEDLVQDTYLKAFRGFATFKPGSNFRAWIFCILRNTFLSSRMSAQYRLHVAVFNADECLAKLPSRSLDPVAILIDRALLDAVQAAVQRLPIILRDVFVLCDLQGASYRETAEALSIPLGTVMSRLSRARKAVGESMHAIVINGNAKTRGQQQCAESLGTLRTVASAHSISACILHTD